MKSFSKIINSILLFFILTLITRYYDKRKKRHPPETQKQYDVSEIVKNNFFFKFQKSG